MINDKTYKDKIKVLEKLVKNGYDDDKKIKNLKLEDLINISEFNRTDLTIAVGIKEAISNNNLVAFLFNRFMEGGD